MENFGFYMPTRLFFGAGSVKRLAKVRLPQGTGLIITGGTSTTKLGYVAKVADTLAEAGHPDHGIQQGTAKPDDRGCARVRCALP